MKKNLFFLAMLMLSIFLVSCSTEQSPISEMNKKEEAAVRTSSLTLTVTFKNKSIASYTASKFIIVDEVDGVRVTLNPGVDGSQALTSVESVLVNSGTFKVTRSNGTVYSNKTYLLSTDGSSSFNTTLNPGSINFSDAQIIVEEVDGV